jgi:hypothetical protein
MLWFKSEVSYKTLYRFVKLKLGFKSKVESDIYDLLREYCGKKIADRIWKSHAIDVLHGFTMPSPVIFGIDIFTEYLDDIVDKKPDNPLSRVMYPDYEPNEHGELVKLKE